MSALSTAAAQRAAMARAARRVKADPSAAAELEHLRAEYAVTKIADFVRRTVDAAPPLTDEQRQRLASVLTSGGDAA